MHTFLADSVLRPSKPPLSYDTTYKDLGGPCPSESPRGRTNEVAAHRCQFEATLAAELRNAEEDVADAADAARRTAAELRLNQLREVQAALRAS